MSNRLSAQIQESLKRSDDAQCAETLRWMQAHAGDAHDNQLDIANEVITYACEIYKEPRSMVMSESRQPRYGIVRQCIVRVLYEVVGMSYKAIGRVIRDDVPMDHTSVMAIYRKAKAMKGRNDLWIRELALYARSLQPPLMSRGK